jgi:hypothetical protein
LALAAFIITTEIVFLYFMSSAGVEFAVSSIAVTVAVLLQLRFGMREDTLTPADIVVFIFSWLFLDLAPKIQLLSVPRVLVNTSTVVPELVLITNLICALFIVTFTIAYASLNRRSRIANKGRPANGLNGPADVLNRRADVRNTPADVLVAGDVDSAPAPDQFGPVGIGAAVGLCVLLVAALGRSAYAVDDTPGISPADMIVHKFLLFLPSATLLILLHETLRSGRKVLFSRVCVLLLLGILVAVTQNPLTEKRNGLGPIYLSILFVLFELKLRSQNRRLILLLVSMVVIFPAITVLTHHRSQIATGVPLDAVVSTLKDHYFSTHYDAWANIYTTVEMVQRQGIHWGQQLLGSVLFFVPSSLWHTKPLATGIAIGNYLISNYSMWFTNLSAPLVGEAYIDFGAPGVALYAVALAWLVTWMNKVAAAGRKWVVFPLMIYGAFFLMFALRGSLMIAFAYGAGGLLSFLAASALLSAGSRQIGQRYFRANVLPLLPGHGRTSRFEVSSLQHKSRG